MVGASHFATCGMECVNQSDCLVDELTDSDCVHGSALSWIFVWSVKPMVGLYVSTTPIFLGIDSKLRK